MQSGELPQDVMRFIVEKIDTVPHLEALLLVWRYPGEYWTAEMLAGRIYVNTDQARTVLRDLEQRGLVKRKGEPVAHYAYDAAWDTEGSMMNQVATTYRQQLIPVTTLIHSKASRAVLEFARAFEIKKDS